MTSRNLFGTVGRSSSRVGTLFATTFILGCGGAEKDEPVRREAGRMSIANQETGTLDSRTTKAGRSRRPDSEAAEDNKVVELGRGGERVVITVEPGAAPDDVREELAEFLTDQLGVEVDPNDISDVGAPAPTADQDAPTDFITLSPMDGMPSAADEPDGSARCPAVFDWAQNKERMAKKDSTQHELAIMIRNLAQQGDCETAEWLAEQYKTRFQDP